MSILILNDNELLFGGNYDKAMDFLIEKANQAISDFEVKIIFCRIHGEEVSALKGVMSEKLSFNCFKQEFSSDIDDLSEELNASLSESFDPPDSDPSRNYLMNWH